MTSTELIPRATVEEIVAHRNKALELYREAFAAIAEADYCIKAAHAEAALAAGDCSAYVEGRPHEVEEFHKAVQLPDGPTYLEVARRLTDISVWSWVIKRTELEKLMDAEAKEKLRRQMRYVSPKTRYNGSGCELVTEEQVDLEMPPVTVENIYATLQTFAGDAENIFRRGIANAFSKLDRRFKSHDGFKIGSRIILTYVFDDWGQLRWGSQARDTLLDVERAFAVVENGNHLGAAYGGGLARLDRDRNGSGMRPHQTETNTEYFKIRGYMNGNAHLWFTRDDLVEKVNKILAEWYGEVIGDGNTAQPDAFAEAAKRMPARVFGFFPTPPELAKRIVDEYVSLYRDRDKPPLTILEPSAGTGNLARLCATAGHPAVRGWGAQPGEPAYSYGHHVDCVEIQPALATALRKEGIYRRVITGDFLQQQPDPGRLYDRIVMNPPFDLERDCDHVMHALKFLKPDGELTAIMSAGVEYRETRKASAFRKAIEKRGSRFGELPPCSFSSVGSNVNTVVLRLHGGKGRTFY